jgi:hypothetical protein
VAQILKTIKMADTKLLCPKCGSDQITANKKGFSGKKAVAGAVLTGGVGILAGTIGSNKIKITCLSCGNQFKPGQGASSQEQVIENKKNDKAATKWTLIILGGLLLIYGAMQLFDSSDKPSNSNKKEETLTGSYNDIKNPIQTQFITNIMTYAMDKQSMPVVDISSNIDKIIGNFFKESNKKISDWQAKVLYTSLNETKQHIIMHLEAGQLKSDILECLVLVDQMEDPKDKNNLLKKGTEIFNKASSLMTDQSIKFSAEAISYEPTKVEKSGDKISIITRIKVKLTEVN